MPTHGTPLHSDDVGTNGAVGEVVLPVPLVARSEDIGPPGSATEVNGCSAATEKALPYGPARV